MGGDSRATRLKFVAELAAGGTPAVDVESHWAEGDAGIPWVTIGDMTRSTRVVSTSRTLTPEGLAAARLRVGRPGTLLLSMYANLGALATLETSAAWNQAILGITPKTGVNAGFLRYALMALRPTLSGLARSSTQDNLNAEQVGNLPIYLLAPKAQADVADFLDREGRRVDDLHIVVRAQVEALDEYRSGVVWEAGQGLRHRPLKYGFQVIDCKHRTPGYISVGYPVISTREVKRGALALEAVARFVDEGDYKDLREHGRDPRPGDIIYSRNATVGVAAYVDKRVEVCLGQDVVLISRRPRDCALLAYVLNFAVEEQVERLSVGSTFSRINVPTVRSLVVPDDDAAAETAAARAIEESFLPLAKAEQAMRAVMVTLSEYRDALVTEAVTGKLDVTKVSEQQLDESAHAAMEGELPEVLSA